MAATQLTAVVVVVAYITLQVGMALAELVAAGLAVLTQWMRLVEP
jgi:hypothetical protein